MTHSKRAQWQKLEKNFPNQSPPEFYAEVSLHHNKQYPHHCIQDPNPSVNIPLISALIHEQHRKILKLLHSGKQLLPDPGVGTPRFSN